MNLDLETIFVWRETARISLFQSRSTEAVVGKSKRFPKKKAYKDNFSNEGEIDQI